MYTTILASTTHRRLAEKLMRTFERTGEVIVESKNSVAGIGGNGKECAEKTVKYIQQKRVTGVVLLSSKELDSFLKGDSKFKLQIAGEDAILDGRHMADAFKREEDVRSKLLIVVPNDATGNQVNCLPGIDVVTLGSNESSWDKEIVARFMQKISLRR